MQVNLELVGAGAAAVGCVFYLVKHVVSVNTKLLDQATEHHERQIRVLDKTSLRLDSIGKTLDRINNR